MDKSWIRVLLYLFICSGHVDLSEGLELTHQCKFLFSGHTRDRHELTRDMFNSQFDPFHPPSHHGQYYSAMETKTLQHFWERWNYKQMTGWTRSVLLTTSTPSTSTPWHGRCSRPLGPGRLRVSLIALDLLQDMGTASHQLEGSFMFMGETLVSVLVQKFYLERRGESHVVGRGKAIPTLLWRAGVFFSNVDIYSRNLLGIWAANWALTYLQPHKRALTQVNAHHRLTTQ